MFASYTIRRMAAASAAVILAIALFLTVASPSPGASRPRHYRVHAGDTLWSIVSSRYPGADTRAVIYDIQHANDLSSSTIAVGERLVLP
jgi:LysM repeat protein